MACCATTKLSRALVPGLIHSHYPLRHSEQLPSDETEGERQELEDERYDDNDPVYLLSQSRFYGRQCLELT
jgi:hypothetical protein